MKYKIALLALLVLVMNSCKKSFLELPSQTELTSGTFFKNEDDFKKAINGAYAPLRQLSVGSNAYYRIGEMHSDNVFLGFTPACQQCDPAGEEMTQFTTTATNGIAQGVYVLNYLLISRVNQILSLIDAASFDDNSKKNIKGQALFLRALSYFELVQYFGKIPLHLTPVTSYKEAALPLSDEQAVYAQIIADAQSAASLLPNKTTQEPGRATSGAAQTLLGNVYVVLKKWSEAETALKAVVTSGQYSLMSSYAAVFDPANKNNSESVFEIQFKEGSEGYANSNIEGMLPPTLTSAQLAVLLGVSDASSVTTNTGFNIPTPDLIAAYAPGDLRKDASIGTVLGSNGILYPYAKKFAHPHAQWGLGGDDWLKYRYSEVLLLLAEALNEQGKSAEALSNLNLVHAHPRTGLTPIGSGSQSQLRDIIFDERRVELALEGKRWLDLVRSGKAIATITAYGARVKATPQAYYYPVGYLPAANVFTSISLLFPLPASEALLSPYF